MFVPVLDYRAKILFDSPPLDYLSWRVLSYPTSLLFTSFNQQQAVLVTQLSRTACLTRFKELTQVFEIRAKAGLGRINGRNHSMIPNCGMS